MGAKILSSLLKGLCTPPRPNIPFWVNPETGLSIQALAYWQKRALKSIYSQEYQSLLDVLVAARKASNLTQQALADRLGRPQSYISKTETGERRLDVVEFLHFCNGVGIDPCIVLAQFTRNPVQTGS